MSRDVNELFEARFGGKKFRAYELRDISRARHRHLDELLHLPRMRREHQDAIGQVDGLIQIVGDEDDRDIDFTPDLQQMSLHARARLRIERAEGLIHEQDTGLVRQRAHDRDPLLHAAGELGWVGVSEFLKSDQIEPQMCIRDSIGIGRIRQGTLRAGRNVALREGAQDRGVAKIGQVLTFKGLRRVSVEEAAAGDIVAVTGIEDVNIGLTICDLENPQGLPPIQVDEPTLAMNFQVNTSPLAGREGKFVTSRQIGERLHRELQSNVALRVEDTADADVFRVLGRGELHLTILVETMRREGYELAVGKPQVLRKIVDGEVLEPFEALTVDIDEAHQGGVMEALGKRRAELTDMVIDGTGRVRLEYRVPARGLIGFQGEFMTLTRGTGLISHVFDGYAAVKGEIPDRHNGVLVSNEDGEAVAYALFALQERGRLFVSPGEKLYEGCLLYTSRCV